MGGQPEVKIPWDREGLQMKYYVLKPRGTDAHAIASRSALRAYAEAIKNYNLTLADDLREWADAEEIKAD